jgi:hypothetical protein
MGFVHQLFPLGCSGGFLSSSSIRAELTAPLPSGREIVMHFGHQIVLWCQSQLHHFKDKEVTEAYRSAMCFLVKQLVRIEGRGKIVASLIPSPVLLNPHMASKIRLSSNLCLFQ